MTIFISSARQDKKNTSYPFEKRIESVADLAEAVAYDHVGCRFTDGKNNRGNLIKAYRSNKCFRSADVVIMDCDNTSQDPTKDLDPSEWKTPEDVKKAFPDVEFYVVYSRNHMKAKNGKAPRPKFHIYLPLSKPITDFKALEKLKEQIYKVFPAFDPNAIKVTQFMFGVENPQVEYVAGTMCVDSFIRDLVRLPDVIEEGSRNATLSAFAGRIITRYGDTEQAHDEFLRAAERCSTPLPAEELATIWRSAQGFYHTTVSTDPTYQDPASYDFGDKHGFTLQDMERLLKATKIKIRFNDITAKMEIAGLPTSIAKGEVATALPGYLRSYMNEKGIHCSRSDMDDYLNNILARNHFNPVENLLLKTTWDGQDRIGEIISILGIDSNSFEAGLVRKWLHQCVALALNDPNEPYGGDGVLVLQGDQGIGKTLFCSKLALNPDWFAEGVSIDMGNKDTIIQSTGVWIAELGELDSTLKKEQSVLKAFLTARKDTYRVPYGRASITRPRRTSFCATVNPQQFLNDETGSRRFWVVRPVIDLDKLLSLDKGWITQLWRQVYEELYLPNPAGFRLTKEEQTTLLQNNEVYSKNLSGEIELLDKLNWEAPESQWRWKKVSEVAELVGARNASTVQVGRVLAKLEKTNEKVQMKTSHNVKQYLVPPAFTSMFF